jgi:hypothetical protein
VRRRWLQGMHWPNLDEQLLCTKPQRPREQSALQGRQDIRPAVPSVGQQGLQGAQERLLSGETAFWKWEHPTPCLRTLRTKAALAQNPGVPKQRLMGLKSQTLLSNGTTKSGRDHPTGRYQRWYFLVTHSLTHQLHPPNLAGVGTIIPMFQEGKLGHREGTPWPITHTKGIAPTP